MEDQIDQPETITQFMTRIQEGLNIHELKMPTEVIEFLDASQEERYSWDREKCLQISCDVNKYMGALEQQIAKHRVRVRWFNYHLDFLHGKYALEYGSEFVRIDHKLKMMNSMDDKCKILVRKILEDECKIQELYPLLNTLSKFYQTLQYLSKEKYVS